jgi:hypothetical protein
MEAALVPPSPSLGPGLASYSIVVRYEHTQRAVNRRVLIVSARRGYAILLHFPDTKFVTDNSAETVGYSRFLELHNICTTAAEPDVSGADRGLSPERKLLIPNNSVWNREFVKPLWASRAGVHPLLHALQSEHLGSNKLARFP